jgi:hypothetical protein
VLWLLLAHLLSTGLLSGWLVMSSVQQYGIHRTGEWSLGYLMSWGWYALALALALPLAVLEVWALRTSRTWLALLAAVAAAVPITWTACLPVALRFFAVRDPVEQSDVEAAVTSLVLLVGAQAVLVVVTSVLLGAGRRR